MTDVPNGFRETPATRETELRTHFRAIAEAQTVRRPGETVELHRLYAELESPERRRRERAWRLESARRLEDAPALSELWRSLVATRAELTAEAGARSYPALRRQRIGATSMAAEDGRRAQLAVEEFVTSVLVRLHERRRRRLGLRTIRPWDLWTVPPGFSADPVFGTKGEAVEAVSRALARAGHADEIGGALEAFSGPLRSDKELGAFLAECGGAMWHAAVSDQARDGSEQKDVAGVALPLLVLHGVSNAENEENAPTPLNRARIRHLERRLLQWTFGAMIDAFEEWTCSHPLEAEHEDSLGATWSSLWLRFLPAVDWAGLEDELKFEWQRHPALFLRPGESVIRIARELEVFRGWIQATDCRTWFQALVITGRAVSDPVRNTAAISDPDLLEVARWMEDTIEELEDGL
jgi:oligoendopeptidase F